MPEHQVPVQVFIADDSALIRSRVATLLACESVTVVGEAATPEASIQGILALQPDVVVLDVQLQGGSGLQVLRAVQQAAPEVAFVVFSNHASPAFRQRYLQEGASRFLDKSSDFGQLAQAVATASHTQGTHHDRHHP